MTSRATTWRVACWTAGAITAALLSGMGLGGCAAEAGGGSGGSDGAGAGARAERLAVTCTGKCDGLSTVRSLVPDPGDLDLGDLMNQGTGLATDELNDSLTASYGGASARAEVDAPSLYGLPEVAEDDLTITNLRGLVAGLARRYGDNELTTEVNATRVEHLLRSDDDLYAESAFRLRAGLRHGWTMEVGGLDDASVSVGFGGGELEGRVIGAFQKEWRADTAPMYQALDATRGFVLPRSADDVREMKPGELVALRGEGWAGLNLGVGVPILVADPASSAVTYRLVVSAGMRTHLEGTVDVQLVRMRGNEVIVDVGTERATVRAARLALRDGWGVQGLVESEVEVAGQTVDLGGLLDKALRKALDRKLDLLEAELERSTRRSRISLARFRFQLDSATPGLDEALTQAVKGDVRLAQALGNVEGNGVKIDFDLLRSGVTPVSRAGIEIFGLRFFSHTEEREGSAVVQTPGGAQAILFDSLRRESGWFFSSHGYTRASLAGMRFDPATGEGQGEANLFLQVMEGDDWMEHDKLLDHTDAVIRALAGDHAMRVLEEHGNRMHAYVEASCESDAFNPCYEEVLDDPNVVELRELGMGALDDATVDLPGGQRELVRAAGELRLTAQATYEPKATWVGPPATVLLDTRIGDNALGHLASTTDRGRFREAVASHLEVTRVDRELSGPALSDARERVTDEEAAVLDDMARRWEEFRDEYLHLSSVENARIERLGPIGSRMLEVRMPIGDRSAAAYEKATVQSLANARAGAARKAFDDLLERAHDLHEVHGEAAVTYALLTLLPSELSDVRFDVEMDMDDRFGQDFEHYRAAGWEGMSHYGKGRAVELIGGGVFDVEALMEVDEL